MIIANYICLELSLLVLGWLQLERIIFQQRQRTIPCGNYGRQTGPSNFHWGREERIAGS